MNSLSATARHVVGAIVTLGSFATAASGQSASVTATAHVYQPITIVGSRTLDFLNVFPGVAKTIAIGAATSGEFDITATASVPMSLTFTLPVTLTNGANTLAIGTWTGCWSGTNTTTGCTAFTPSGVATASTVGAAGTVFVFVGATVTPTAAQVTGTYTGTVTLTVAYI